MDGTDRCFRAGKERTAEEKGIQPVGKEQKKTPPVICKADVGRLHPSGGSFDRHFGLGTVFPGHPASGGKQEHVSSGGGDGYR